MDSPEHSILARALNVTLVQPEDSSKSGAKPPVFLASLAAELQEDGLPLSLSIDSIDSTLWALIHEKCPSQKQALAYFYRSWRRSEDLIRTLTKSAKPESKAQVEALRRLQTSLISYGLLAATEADVFDIQEASFNTSILMMRPPDDSGRFWDFFNLIAAQAAENGTLAELIAPIISHVNSSILSSKEKPLSTSTAYLDVFEHLASNKIVVEAIVAFDNFIPQDATATSIETTSVLGPMYGISPINPQLALATFTSPSSLSKTAIQNTYVGIRSELKFIQEKLFYISDKIIRNSEQTRNKLLRFFGKLIDLNHKRVAMQVDPNSISSDAIMINITALLIRFCEPFLNIHGSKIDKISPDYFCIDPVYSIEDETMINGDSNEAKAFYSNNTGSSKKSNFISDVFYLAVAYLHYGGGGCLHSHERTRKHLEDMQTHEEYLKRQLEVHRGTPNEHRLNMALNKLVAERKVIKAYYHLVGAVLFDPDAQAKSLSFNLFLSVFLVRFVDPNQKYPLEKISFPFPSEQPPDLFKFLPEYFLDIIPTYFLFFSRNIPDLLIHRNLSPLLTFLVTFLRMSDYAKNPYVKTRFIEVIFTGTIELYINIKGFFVDLFNTDPLCLDNLFHTLMQFYIDIERTGASSQFEDKFNARYYISQIIKTLWNNRVYRDRLESESKTDVEFFVRFVALLLNDATYLLDESLSKLSEIHRLQKELESSDPLQVSTEQTENQRQLASLERMAKSYVQLAQQSVVLLKLFTQAVPKAFVTPELVDRLAAMLDYNLEALVGPKCRELKVKNPEGYGFKPRELLTYIVDVYINLSKEDAFAHAVANDGRSFRPELFERAVELLSKRLLKSPAEIEEIKKFSDKAARYKAETEADEEELGEIPDEFLDPVMFTLMENPVTLPSSKVNIDLSTIKSHLLSDSKDPFNRVPLKIEQVVPNADLKRRIEEFKQSRKRAKVEE